MSEKNRQSALKATFAKNLRRLLFENDETRLELAKAINVHGTTVFSWLHEVSFPREKALQSVANHYGITISQLTSPSYDTAKKQAISYVKHFAKKDKNAIKVTNNLEEIPENNFANIGSEKLSDEQMQEVRRFVERYFSQKDKIQTIKFQKANRQKSFPEKLHFLREQQKLSQNQLSQLLNAYYNGQNRYNTNKISRLENGKNEPTLSDLQAISFVLKVPMDFFMTQKNAIPIDLSNSQLLVCWKGKNISVKELKIIQTFIAGLMHDSQFEIQENKKPD